MGNVKHPAGALASQCGQPNVDHAAGYHASAVTDGGTVVPLAASIQTESPSRHACALVCGTIPSVDLFPAQLTVTTSKPELIFFNHAAIIRPTRG